MTNVEDRVERALHALAEHIEPDVVSARARLAGRDVFTAPLPHCVPRPRAWVTMAAASVAVIGVGAVIAVGTTRQPPAAQTEPTLVPPEPSDVSVNDSTSSPTPSSSSPGRVTDHGRRDAGEDPRTRAARRARSSTGS